MKNCFISHRAVSCANDYCPDFSAIPTIDRESAELFCKLNPILSNGHRANLITRLVDKNVPREVAEIINQLVVNVPHDSRNRGFSDEQINAAITSRDFQNEIELDLVKSYLDSVSNDLFKDSDPVSPDNTPISPLPVDNSLSPSEPAPSSNE